MNSFQSPRKIWPVLAFAFCIMGLACNPFVAGPLFNTGDPEKFRTWQFLIALFDIAAILSGIVIWRNRNTINGRAILLAFAIGCITLAVTELGLRVVSKYLYPHKYMIMADRPQLSFFRDKPWTPALFREFADFDIRVDAYTGWKNVEFHGICLTILPDGSRRTINYGGGDTVLMLGGSSLWGDHLRDEYTIPSLVSGELDRRGTPHHLLNYGARAYTFTQNFALLNMLLREGMHPKTVVLYGGVNEIASAYHFDSVGVVGLSTELNTILRYYRHANVGRIGIALRELVENDLMLFNAAEKMSRAAGLIPVSSITSVQTEQHGAAMAANLSSDFQKTYGAVQALSTVYHFRFFFILQPTIYTKPNLTEEEKTVDAMEGDSTLKELHLKTYAAIDSLHLPGVFDFSGAFDTVNHSVYMDFCHTSEEGSAIVAHKLTDLLVRH